MKIHARSIILAALLTCLLWANTYPSTGKVQINLSNCTMKGPQQVELSNLMFTQQTQDSIIVYTLDSLKLKDPNLAIFYAVIPGAVFHGTGHVYAGRIPTAITLFGCELLGLGLASLGAVSQIEGPNDPGDNAIFIGSMIFIGTWLYDLIGSPLAVQRRNRELLDQKPVGLEFRTKDGNGRVSVVWRF